jgi:UDP-N-acetylmuramate--alanine ligase
MRADLAAMFAAELRPDDRLVLLPVFDAGGTADRSVRSEDLAGDLAALGVRAECAADPGAARAFAAAWARPGDILATLGARDPALPRLARSLRDAP